MIKVLTYIGQIDLYNYHASEEFLWLPKRNTITGKWMWLKLVTVVIDYSKIKFNGATSIEGIDRRILYFEKVDWFFLSLK